MIAFFRVNIIPDFFPGRFIRMEHIEFLLIVLDKFLNKFIKLIGIKSQEKAITEEEIMSMIKAAEEEGSIKEIEKKMIDSIFEFDDINVGEIATPRTDMVLVESKSNIGNVMKLIASKKFSRMPVYEKNRDNIVGIVYIKDVMMFRGKHVMDAMA